MKKRLCILPFLIAAIFVCSVTAFAAEEDITLKLDGKVVQTEVPPIMISGRTMTPAKFLFEGMGGTVEWMAESEQVRIELNDMFVLLTINSRTAQVNGENKTMDVAPIIRNQRTLIPASFVAQELGCGVKWIGSTNTVEITTAGEIAAGEAAAVEKNHAEKDQDSTGSGLGDYEKQVVELVNKERGAAGLSALSINQELSRIAETKAADMRDNNYFSHTSPTYGLPFDMMKRFGITYKAAGENIAKGQRSPGAVVKSWMDSEGHRENILNSSYTEIGVGYVTDSRGNTYWVQMFIRP